MSKAEAEALAMQYLERVHIAHQADKFPGQLFWRSAAACRYCSFIVYEARYSSIR